MTAADKRRAERREAQEARIAAAIQRDIANAPPFTLEQVERLRALLYPSAAVAAPDRK